jgi:hypothetical protein
MIFLEVFLDTLAQRSPIVLNANTQTEMNGKIKKKYPESQFGSPQFFQ